MTPERWQQIRTCYEQASALTLDKRPALLQQIGTADPQLREEVESLLAYEERAHSTFLKQPAADFLTLALDASTQTSRTGKRIGVYEVREQIGRGGMGEVYRAARVDGQYEKQVAIKLVRGGFDTASVIQRFRQERQILASLDHPNIARLLDGGTTEDGIPYLVMELIEGIPIDQYCDQHKRNITQRVELFRQVCAAVQYAHQRLVVHRDIKPGNILVTQDGIPKLLDFGIAKILDPTSGVETTLLRPMTPEYASPEQIRGEVITTASDVYSLGIVLYRLLTGGSPYGARARTPHELAHAICELEPGRPSTGISRLQTGSSGAPSIAAASQRRAGTPAKLRQCLSGDLDNIVLKALRKEPGRRYASVEQLDEDLRRHLEGLPVSARRGSRSYRAGKFVKRHRLSMIAAALVLFAILAGVGATLREARVAQANAERAQRRFDDVRKLANSLLFEINDSIREVPGSIAAQKLLIDRAVQYLDSLAQESGSDAALQRELAMAYLRVGDVQGFPFVPNLGNTKGALASYQKAQAIEDPLYRANPQSLDDGLNLAIIERRLCELESVDQNITGALAQGKRAVEIGEQLAARFPQNAKVEIDLAKDYQTLAGIVGGNSSANMGDTLGALNLHERTVTIAEKAAAANPQDRTTQRFLAGATERFGNQLAEVGRLREAEAQDVRSLNILQTLLSRENETSQHDVAEANLNLGTVQVARGENTVGEASFQKTIEILAPLVRAEPRNALLQTTLFLGFMNLGDVQADLGKRRDAARNFEMARRIGERLEVTNPTAEVRTYLADLLIVQGQAKAKIGQLDAALRDYRGALGRFEKLSAEDPANIDSRLSLAATYDKVGEALARERDAEGASKAFRVALRLTLAATADHSNTQLLYVIADSNTGLGDATVIVASSPHQSSSARLRLYQEAERAYQESLDTWKQVLEPGLVSVDGFRSTPPSEVSRRIEACRHAGKSLSVPE